MLSSARTALLHVCSSKNYTPNLLVAKCCMPHLRCRRALYPKAQVLNESEAVIADIKKQYPAVKKIGAVG